MGGGKSKEKSNQYVKNDQIAHPMDGSFTGGSFSHKSHETVIEDIIPPPAVVETKIDYKKSVNGRKWTQLKDRTPLTQGFYIKEYKSIKCYCEFTIHKLSLDPIQENRDKYCYTTIRINNLEFNTKQIQENGEWNETFYFPLRDFDSNFHVTCSDKESKYVVATGIFTLSDFKENVDNRKRNLYLYLQGLGDKGKEEVIIITKIRLESRDKMESQFMNNLITAVIGDSQSLTEFQAISIMELLGHSMTEDDLKKTIGPLITKHGIIREKFFEYITSAKFVSEPLAYTLLSYQYMTLYDISNFIASIYDRLEFDNQVKFYNGHKNPQSYIDTILYKEGSTELTNNETIPKLTLIFNYLYQENNENTIILLQKLTQYEGVTFNSKESKSLIEPFVDKYNIPTDCWDRNIDEYSTFNEFFSRRLKPGFRTITENHKEDIICCSDSKVIVVNMKECSHIWIKSEEFTLKKLLDNRYEDLSHIYDDCIMTIHRLAPNDYHHFHWPVSGTLTKITYINNENYLPIHPITLRSNADVLSRNKKFILEIETDHLGLVTLIPIGCTLVGSIKLTKEYNTPMKITIGDDAGYFLFGGSACVMLYERNKVDIDPLIVNNSQLLIETMILYGTVIGYRKLIPL